MLLAHFAALERTHRAWLSANKVQLVVEAAPPQPVRARSVADAMADVLIQLY